MLSVKQWVCEDVKSSTAKGPGCFHSWKKVPENRKISLQTKIRVLEATKMTVVKYGSEVRALRKMKEDLLDLFQKYYLWIILVTWLSDHISNTNLY